MRRITASFFDRSENPTLKTVLEKVKENPINFKGSKSSLQKILKKSGFRYSKVTSGRKLLMERVDLVVTR